MGQDIYRFEQYAKPWAGAPFGMMVEARLENLAIIAHGIETALGERGLRDEIHPILLAVDEACTNIIQHSYEGSGRQEIAVGVYVDGDEVVVRIRDWGRPFDPDCILPPDLTADAFERRPGGLGMFLMRCLMDEVSYTFMAGEYNEVVMVRRLTGIRAAS